ncbi:hypothetical protein C8Q69DRAFT_508433 [Paecilomyces variotii]|uniref:Uncharacterized protein n=1 Tax=Byssochlamys spectabilis TaxID=264951 RepID=A0A443HQJ1_BYSSP|nr:hypothetical protein C8Q69DRAFT_508433 [Paecilomyces variotii]KAJ9257853.1 hypothetical protein DTO212C5_8829 [Paecilomyces variotii]KAJ9310643.1 hypothetical protein DTO271D3_9096 [Paecilomyces variotii]KAJ9358181.1 hypothetical protein DTO280E4_5290 [Paecilomyces variotii]RWQ94085.1 hypothetical protein C8Q69DRAFT_508433 [Paecilomyces variotii]
MQQDKSQLIHSLRTHRINTITELRRVEKVFAQLGSADVTEPMTSAWLHYVNSNNLLNELRGLTKNYHFSSECLDEAKWLVSSDPQSCRSWNYCWLILTKIQEKQLIPKHARILAAKPAMWGDKQPTPELIEWLSNECIKEWTAAVQLMLRHWETPPTTTGR